MFKALSLVVGILLIPMPASAEHPHDRDRPSERSDRGMMGGGMMPMMGMMQQMSEMMETCTKMMKRTTQESEPDGQSPENKRG